MRISLSIAFLSIVLFFSCNSPQDDSGIIDYSSLDKLSSELVLEVGESEDYIPGRIKDVKVTPDGTILVGDMGNITVEQFNSEGEFVGTVAEGGRGPSEISHIFSLHLLNGDTLVVRNFSGKKNYYARTGGERFEHINSTVQNNHTTRTLEVLKPVTEDKFYAVKSHKHHETLKNPKPTVNEAFVEVNESEKVLEDSVHILKHRGRYSVELESSGYLSSTFPFQNHEQVVVLENGNYMVARPDSSAFFVYNEDHKLKRRIPVSVKERPVTDEDLEYEFDGLPDKAISKVNNMRSDFKPPYYRVFASSSYFWLQTDKSKDGTEVVVLDFDGMPVGKFMLAEHDRITHVEDDKIYTVNRNPERGNKIHVYEINLTR